LEKTDIVLKKDGNKYAVLSVIECDGTISSEEHYSLEDYQDVKEAKEKSWAENN